MLDTIRDKFQFITNKYNQTKNPKKINNNLIPKYMILHKCTDTYGIDVIVINCIDTSIMFSYYF